MRTWGGREAMAPTRVSSPDPLLATNSTPPPPSLPAAPRPVGRLIILSLAVLLAGPGAVVCAAAIALHVTTELAFNGITFGIAGGQYTTRVPDSESAILTCVPPEAPIPILAGCRVGDFSCDSMSSMMPSTSISGHAGDVRFTVEASGMAVVDGGIITKQRVVCFLNRRKNDGATRAARMAPANASASSVGLEWTDGKASFAAAGTDETMVAARAKDLKDKVVAMADHIGPFAADAVVDVRYVDVGGSGCDPASSHPYMTVADVSSQAGPLACQPLADDSCGGRRCVLPASTTMLAVTLEPGKPNSGANDPLFAQVSVVLAA